MEEKKLNREVQKNAEPRSTEKILIKKANYHHENTVLLP